MNRQFSGITPASWITIGRFLLIPMVLVPLIAEGADGHLRAFVWFMVAMLSDSLDGYIARRFNQVSDLGKFLDPLVDKLLMLPILFVLCAQGVAPILSALIILGREVVVVIWRWRALRQGRSFSASWAAKIKTDCLTAGMGLLLIASLFPWPETIRMMGEMAIHGGAVMALISAFEYLPRRQTQRNED